MLFRKCSGLIQCFLAKSNLALFAPCGEPSVFVLLKSSLDCRLLAECCETFWRGFSDHPPLLSFVDIQAFLCCWAHQCVSFFSECTKLSIWIQLSLWWIWFVLKPNNCLFPLHGELLWLHDVGSQQQLSNANRICPLKINSRTFTCLIDE